MKTLTLLILLQSLPVMAGTELRQQSFSPTNTNPSVNNLNVQGNLTAISSTTLAGILQALAAANFNGSVTFQSSATSLGNLRAAGSLDSVGAYTALSSATVIGVSRLAGQVNAISALTGYSSVTVLGILNAAGDVNLRLPVTAYSSTTFLANVGINQAVTPTLLLDVAGTNTLNIKTSASSGIFGTITAIPMSIYTADIERTIWTAVGDMQHKSSANIVGPFTVSKGSTTLQSEVEIQSSGAADAHIKGGAESSSALNLWSGGTQTGWLEYRYTDNRLYLSRQAAGNNKGIQLDGTDNIFMGDSISTVTIQGRGVVGGVFQTEAATNHLGPLTVNGSSVTVTSDFGWGTAGAKYMYGKGGTQRFAYTDTNTNILYSGGTSLNVHNQADNVVIAKFLDGGITQILGSGLQVGTGGTPLAVISTGTYTPTIANEVNIGATTPGVTSFVRIGNIVTVYGRLNIDPTTTATNTSFTMSLPIASNFTAQGDCGGTFAIAGSDSGSTGGVAGSIYEDSTNDAAFFNYLPIVVTNATYGFNFTYTIK